MSCRLYTVSPKNWTRILWSITFTNIGQYQCHLTELFVQQYLIIYHKIIHTAEYQLQLLPWQPAPLVQTNVCAITAHLPIVHVPPSSICATPRLISLIPTSGHLIATTYPVDYRIWGCIQDPCLSEAHTQHQRAETAHG